MTGLGTILSDIHPADRATPEAVRRRLDELTKPPGSLGCLEELAVRLARIYGDPPPPLRRRTVFVLAGDHGVSRRAVSAYPREVTLQMCRNLAAGGAAVSSIARAVDARVVVADLGVDGDLSDVPGVRDHKVRAGTRDLWSGPAMTPREALLAVEEGISLFESEAGECDIVALGEMGIGNTTAASALTSALLGRDADEVVGPGTGVAAEARARKVEAVRNAVSRVRDEAEPLEVLAQLGGLEIAGLVGVVLAAARSRLAVVTDGFIATSAVLVATRILPVTLDYVFPSHCSPEPGHRALLEALGLNPLFELEMRLGEGTGAALALPLLDSAGSVLREMATFGSAGVSNSVAVSRRAGRESPPAPAAPGLSPSREPSAPRSPLEDAGP